MSRVWPPDLPRMPPGIRGSGSEDDAGARGDTGTDTAHRIRHSLESTGNTLPPGSRRWAVPDPSSDLPTMADSG